MLKLVIPDVSVGDDRCRKFLNLAIFIDGGSATVCYTLVFLMFVTIVSRCGNSFFWCCADVFLDAQRICCKGVLHQRILPVLHLRKYVASLDMYSFHCTFQVSYVPVTVFQCCGHCFQCCCVVLRQMSRDLWHRDRDLRGNFDFKSGT
jgi:hypothetical protein